MTANSSVEKSEAHDIRVLGVWEQGWNSPWMEHDLWVFPLRDYGVPFWGMAPVSGIQKNEGLHEFQTLANPVKQARGDGYTVVWVDERAEIPLGKFRHPARACYVFGRSSYAPCVEFREPTLDPMVKIPTPMNQGLLWAHQALCLVLADRMRGFYGSYDH